MSGARKAFAERGATDLVALVARGGGVSVGVDITPIEARELAAELLVGANEIDPQEPAGLLRNKRAQATMRRVRADMAREQLARQDLRALHEEYNELDRPVLSRDIIGRIGRGG